MTVLRSIIVMMTFLFTDSLPAQTTITKTLDIGGGGDVGRYTSLAIVNGNPSIAYWNSTEGDLRFARNSQPNGLGTWTISTLYTSGGTNTSLAVVDGNPAICFTGSSTIYYVRALDANGTTWGSPFNFGNGGAITTNSLKVINGYPAVCFFDGSGSDLKYRRALDSTGAMWGPTLTLDSTGIVGDHASMAVVNGNPAISYFNGSSFDLKYVRALDPSGATWGTPLSVDTVGNVGGYTSLAVVNGNPAVCYFDFGNSDLRFVRATDADGTTWGPSLTLDSTGNVGKYASLAVVNGKPAISYCDEGMVNSAKLKYVRSADTDGATWSPPIVADMSGMLGLYTSLAVVSGNPAISYYDSFYGDLRFLRASDANGTGWATGAGSAARVDTGVQNGAVGGYTSQAIINGNPAVCYFDYLNEDLKYVRALDATGTSWGTPKTLAGVGILAGRRSSLRAVGGNPAVSYYDSSNTALKYMRSSDSNGATWPSSITVDNTGPVGEYSSLAVVNGNPAIAYYDGGNYNLKYVRANDPAGTTWGTPLILDSAGTVGEYPSLVVVNGNPAISYRDSTNRCAKYIRAIDASGTIWAPPVTVSAGAFGSCTSLAVVNGLPAIVCIRDPNISLSFVRALDPSGATWGSPVQLEAGSSEPSLVVINGNPAISYWIGGSEDLRYIRSLDASGQSWGSPTTVDSVGRVGQYNSLVEANGNPAISYLDLTNFDLKWATLTSILSPEITIERADAGFTDIAGGSNQSLGATLVTQATELNFRVKNSGNADLVLTGNPRVSVTGSDFTVVTQPDSATLSPTASAAFTIRFAPTAAGTRMATMTVQSNDPDEATLNFTLSGAGILPLTMWRELHFGTSQNSGDSADVFDFDKDGTSNLIEYAFGLNPKQADINRLPQLQVVSSSVGYRFTQPPEVTGIAYTAEWSPSLLPASWLPISDTGISPEHVFDLPIGTGAKVFLRLVVTAQ